MIGRTVSHYRILEKLGCGGMGVVYRAEDLRLGRTVALKFLPPHLDTDAAARERFIQEAKAASSLDHPNTCTIHEIDTTEDGQIFIVMSLYLGETLEKKIARGPLPADLAVAIALDTARGLAKAHRLGIVHRDVKPSNLMITEEGVVKILDFGIAKLAGEVRHTQAGRIVGSVDYMSPEQARGEEVDRRTDIWSLGVVLYEMLTGQKPFRGGAYNAVLYNILHTQPRPMAELVAGLPEHLVRVVARALAKWPMQRFENLDEMAAALSGEAVRTQGMIVSPPARSSIAVLPFVDMSPEADQEYFCDGVAEELIHVLSGVPGLRVASRTSAFRFKGRAGDLGEIRGVLGVATLLEGGVRTAGRRLRVSARLVDLADGYQLWSGRYDREVTDIFAIQEEIARTIVETLKPKLLGTSEVPSPRGQAPDFEVYNLYLKGRYHCNKRTEDGLTKSIASFETVIARAPDYAAGYVGLADAYVLLGVYGLAAPAEVMPKARIAALRALELEDAAPQVHTSLGCLRSVYDWSWAEAERDFRRALELDPGYATAHHWYAVNYLAALRRFDEAREEIRIAHELDPLSLPISVSAGLISFFAAQFDQALEAFQRTLELDDSFAVAHLFRGQTYACMGRGEEALISLRRAVELSGGAPEAHAALAHACAVSGREAEARRLLAELLALRRRRYVSASLVAQVYAGLGERDQALAWLEQAHAERAADLAWVGVRPLFDSLRGEPRLAALLAKMGLSDLRETLIDVTMAEGASPS